MISDAFEPDVEDQAANALDDQGMDAGFDDGGGDFDF